MVVLMICSIIHWRKSGMGQFEENWRVGRVSSPSAIARQIFNGFCLGMLGLTGFECTFS